MNLLVSLDFQGVALLDFLFKNLEWKESKRSLKRSIEKGLCIVNSKVERFASRKLSHGDVVEFKSSWVKDLRKDTTQIECLFEDESLLVINKPAGVESTPFIFPEKDLFLVHRLDKGTTGVLLLAKSESVWKACVQEFRNRCVAKEYLALCFGEFQSSEGEVRNHLAKVGDYAGQSMWGEVPYKKGKFAHTKWEVKEKTEGYSLVQCYPITGRTHQIRVHLQGIGHAVVGDFQYHREQALEHYVARPLLHASNLRIKHPATMSVMTFHAPLPCDFKNFLKLININY